MQNSEFMLGDVATITMGTSPKSETYNHDGIGLPLLNGPTDFGPVHPCCTLFTTDSKRECKKGDLIFCVRGSTTGRMNWADQVYSLGRGVCSIRGETPLDTKHIKYCLDYTLEALLMRAGGGTFPNLTRGDMLRFPIPYPPHRHRIAAALSTYDDLIENNARRIAILEQMAQLIYREWFVHFRFPGHEEVRMVDSPLGRIPEGWEVRKVSEVADIYRGRSYRSADLVQGGLPFLNLKCIERDGGFRHDGLKRYGGRYKDTQEARPGDIIMAVTDMTQERRIIARAARVPDIGEGMFVFSMDLVKLVPREDVPSNYLYGMLRFSRFSDEVKQYASGANVLHLRPAHIEQFEFPLPPGYLTERYAALASIAYDQCDALLKKNQLLRRARDLLLPRLISAEIDVSELDIDTGTLGDTHTG